MKKLISSIALMAMVAVGFAQIQVRIGSRDYYNRRDNSRPNSLVVDTRGMRDFTVVVDNRQTYQSNGGQVTISNLRNGNHSVYVYENRNGVLGMGRHRERTVFNSSVNLKPGVETSLFVNRNGQPEITEHSLYNYNSDNTWRNRRNNETRF